MSSTSIARDDELDRLRKENAFLRAQLEDRSQSEVDGQPPGGWRWPVAVLLLVLGGLMLAGTVLAVWMGRTLTNTDRYVETVSPVIESPAVRESLAEGAVNGVFGSVDIEARAAEVLPPRADFLAPSIATNLQSYAQGVAEKFLATPQAQDLWVNANRRAHERILPALLGEDTSPYVDVAEGTVSVDISEIVAQVKSRLVDSGVTIAGQIPVDGAGSRYTLFQSTALAQVQAGLRFLRGAMIWLPLLTVAVLAGGIALAPDRRRAALWLGVVTIVSMIVLAAGLALLRDYYLGSADRLVLDTAAAAAVFDTMFRFLRNAIRVVAALGLTITIASAIAGPSRAARAIRRTATEGVGTVSKVAGLDLGRYSLWVERHRRALDVFGVVIAGVVLLATSTPSPMLVLGLALGVALWLLIIEILARAHGASTTYSRQQPTV